MSELNRLYVPAEHCKISLVVAMGLDRAIGERGAMPWYLPADLKHFKEATIDGCVIMGRKTFESIGKALPKRRNIVVSATLEAQAGIEVVPSLSAALELAQDRITPLVQKSAAHDEVCTYEHIAIIGGARLFEEGFEYAQELNITEIRATFPHADTFFPEFEQLGLFMRESQEPHVLGDNRAYYYCAASQPSGFAQDIPGFDENELVVDSEQRELVIDDLPKEGLAYRHLKYVRI